jgi:hypothetical protein
MSAWLQQLWVVVANIELSRLPIFIGVYQPVREILPDGIFTHLHPRTSNYPGVIRARLGLQPKELPKQDPVVLDSHERFAEMDKDRGVEDTIRVEVEVLDPIVPEHPLEEVARREGKSTLHKSRKHWDLVRILLHQIQISSGDTPQIHLLLAEEPTVDQGEEVLGLQFHLLPLL